MVVVVVAVVIVLVDLLFRKISTAKNELKKKRHPRLLSWSFVVLVTVVVIAFRISLNVVVVVSDICHSNDGLIFIGNDNDYDHNYDYNKYNN